MGQVGGHSLGFAHIRVRWQLSKDRLLGSEAALHVQCKKVIWLLKTQHEPRRRAGQKEANMERNHRKKGRCA